jgi:hypothetical protein
MDALENNLIKSIEEFDKEQFSLFKERIDFYFKNILLNLKDRNENNFKKFNETLEQYILKDEKNIIIFYELFELAYRNHIFNEYNEKKYFEKFLKNIDIYLNLLAW